MIRKALKLQIFVVLLVFSCSVQGIDEKPVSVRNINLAWNELPASKDAQNGFKSSWDSSIDAVEQVDELTGQKIAPQVEQIAENVGISFSNSPSPSATTTPTPSVTPSNTPSPSLTPSSSASTSPSSTPDESPSVTVTASKSPPPTPANSPSPAGEVTVTSKTFTLPDDDSETEEEFDVPILEDSDASEPQVDDEVTVDDFQVDGDFSGDVAPTGRQLFSEKVLNLPVVRQSIFGVFIRLIIDGEELLLQALESCRGSLQPIEPPKKIKVKLRLKTNGKGATLKIKYKIVGPTGFKCKTVFRFSISYPIDPIPTSSPSQILGTASPSASASASETGVSTSTPMPSESPVPSPNTSSAASFSPAVTPSGASQASVAASPSALSSPMESMPSVATVTPSPSGTAELSQYTPDQAQWGTLLDKPLASDLVIDHSPDGVTWVGEWFPWDGTIYDPTKMTTAEFQAAICPKPDQIRGIYDVYYEHNPFKDPKNPTRAEVDEWHRLSVLHLRKLVGATAPLEKDHCLFARALWGQQIKFTRMWDAKYPDQSCEGTTNSHCGHSFIPDAEDQKPFLPEGHPPCVKVAGSEGIISNMKANIPFSIKWTRGFCTILGMEGYNGGHVGPYWGRTKFGWSFWDRDESDFQSSLIKRGKWSGSIVNPPWKQD